MAEGLDLAGYVPPARKSKVIALEEAGRIIASKRSIHLAAQPMALIRAAIRAGAKGLTVIPPVDASLPVDLLVAAGCVETLYVSYIGFETLGFAPAFRAAAERRTIRIIEADEPFVILGTRAGAGGMPFVPIRNVYEATDLPKLNPMLKRVVDPFTGEEMYAIPPLRAEVCIVHVQECDAYGNAHLWGGTLQEIDKAMASDFVIVSCERIVPVERTREHPDAITLPGHMVHVVVHTPFGAHPLASARHYDQDIEHLLEYFASHKTGAVADYIARYVMEPSDLADYVERVGIRRIMNLMQNI